MFYNVAVRNAAQMAFSQTLLTISGWIVGPVIGYYLQRHAQNKNKQELATELRSQLLTELHDIGDPIKSWPSNPARRSVPDLSNAISTQVYDEQISDLSALTDEEMKSIRDFYSHLQQTQELCDTWVEKAPDDFDYEGAAEGTAELINRNIQSLKEKHTEVVEILEKSTE